MEDRTARFRIGQLSSRTGVPHERLRKWEERYGLLEPERSPGGFRIYSLEDERRVRLMKRHLERGYAAAEAAELARQGIVVPTPARRRTAVPEGVVERSRALLRVALESFDGGAAERTLDDLFKAYAVDAVLRDAVLPFMRAVGEAWAAEQIHPAQEHFASTIVEARLLALTRGWDSGSGPRALLACPSGERHTFGLLAFGIALSRRGWRITYLGADTPPAALAAAARRVGPDLVMLSATQPRRFSEIARELAPTTETYRVVAGGAGATATATERLGIDRIVSDPVTAAVTLATETRRTASAGSAVERKRPA